MRTESPPLAPYLRSVAQARLLAELLLKPDRAMSVTQLAKAVGAVQSVISNEVDRLVTASVLVDERVGRTRLVRANPDYRLIEPLTGILAATFGPEPVMTRLLSELDGIDAAFIYGSWAARYSGVAGRQPGDVDVLVVGTPDRAALNEAVDAAESELGLAVQITRVSPEAWEQATEPFIQTVKAGPLVALRLGRERL